MLYLFQLRCDKEVRLLPIAEQTAALLERALLETDPTSCRRVFCNALRTDPFFAIGVRQAAFQQDELGLTSLTAAVSWLGRETAEKLLPLLADDVASIPSLAARRYASIASRLHLAGSDDAYWQALIAAGKKILASCPQDSIAKPRLLPAFPPTAPRDGYSLTSVRQEVDREADYLLESVPGIAWRLPALLTHLQKQQADQACFDQRLEEEKLLSLRGLAYGASHEINNPLANIAARAQALLRDETEAGRRKKLSAIHNQAMRAHEMIADLMLFAHPPKLDLASCDLWGVAQKVVAELESQAAQQRIQLSVDSTPEGIFAIADKTQLAVALRAVIANSLEAIGNDGEIVVSAGTTESDGSAWLSVRDDGPGIATKVRKHMFDPFYSGREAGRGHGFGLSKCWRILREHDGTVEVKTVEVTSSDPCGTEIVLRLPMAESHQRAA